ncbi:MAG TPA: multicopper oxidase domain-containing protein [Rhizomicrobium sp.]|nr:multicopper oxidase domain-containing protein [Rhizomicrobium sp.]
MDGKLVRHRGTGLIAFLVMFLFAAVSPHAFADSRDPCPRPVAGSEARQSPDLYSQNGVLKLHFDYYTTLDKLGRTLFCFVTSNKLESPTLHVNPGDTIDLTVSNRVPPAGGPDGEVVSGRSNVCGDAVMTISSVNVHFHGTNTAPQCHSDEVVHTLINSGQTFRYQLKIPKDEPPGMYWYHPHVHGISGKAVEGGASGAIEVEGIANLQPAVAGLPQRFLVMRDQRVGHPPKGQFTIRVPSWDISLNYVPVDFPKYVPAVIKMKPGAQEFWRVVNAGADTTLDLVLEYDGVAQPLGIVALDGVPTGSQDGKHQGTIITQTDILIPPAGRAEFIVTGPDAAVKKALLVTERIDTGPLGDSDPARRVAVIEQTAKDKDVPSRIFPIAGTIGGERFAGLDDSMVTAHRHLYFSETGGQPGVEGNVTFFITVVGQTPTPYYPDEPPAIITHRGAVEDWTIQNESKEIHMFHMHQIHFQLLAVNGVPVPPEQRQWYDTHEVGYWTGSGPYPSIKVRMDFRGAVVGEFVYHCHILDHEDAGMMANILVKDKKDTRAAQRTRATKFSSRAGASQT